MGLSHQDVGPTILAKIQIYIVTRDNLLYPLCYEIPCSTIDKVDLIKFQCNLPIDRISASIFIPDDQDRRILRPWSRSVAREYGNIPDYSF